MAYVELLDSQFGRCLNHVSRLTSSSARFGCLCLRHGTINIGLMVSGIRNGCLPIERQDHVVILVGIRIYLRKTNSRHERTIWILGNTQRFGCVSNLVALDHSCLDYTHSLSCRCLGARVGNKLVRREIDSYTQCCIPQLPASEIRSFRSARRSTICHSCPFSRWSASYSEFMLP